MSSQIEKTESDLPRNKDVTARERGDRQQWLTLGQASKYLGVHYTTLRTWSDSGDIAVFRTPGGHRRFNLNDLRRFLSDRASADLVGDSNDLVNAAVGRVREQIQQMPHKDQRWLESSDDESRALRRERGRQIFSLAISYVMKHAQRERILADGRVLGQEYGREAAASGVGLAETGQAVQFFRQQLMSAIHEGGGTGMLDADDVRIQRLVNQFIDEVLYAVLDGYEQALTGAVESVANPGWDRDRV